MSDEEAPEFDKSKMTPEEIIQRRDKLLEEWERAKDLLDTAKEDEMSKRLAFIDWAADKEIAKGSEYIDLYQGWRVKIDKKVNYKVSKDNVTMFLDKMVEFGIKNNEEAHGRLMASNVVKWEPELSLSFFNTMPDAYKEIFKPAVSSSNATPTISIEAPKARKARHKSE